jgi:hypothetical protein
MNETERKDLRELSDDDFMEAWTERAKDLDEAKEDCRAYREEHDRRLMKEKFDAMTDAERSALAQYIEAEGIESLEGVGAQSEEDEESDIGTLQSSRRLLFA